MGHDAVRAAVKGAYPKSKGWAARIDRMQDSQVIAIYYRLVTEGKIKVN